jgi:damage-control phosphatase, subfamily I
VVYETDLVASERRDQTVEEALHIIASGYPSRENSAKLATRVHQRVYEVLGRDPYIDLKRRSNLAAMAVLPMAERFIDQAGDRLTAACQVAIAGNVMDFGIDVGMEGPEDFGPRFEVLLREGLQVDEVQKLRKLAENAKEIYYLVDNCGEIVLDHFLVKELQSFGAKVVGVIKGAPILTDVVEEDLKATGMDKAFDSWTTTGTFAVGVDLDRAPELRCALKDADLVIAKGMANFESLSDETLPRVAYLLRAKCYPVAEAIGAKKDDNVVRVIERK